MRTQEHALHITNHISHNDCPECRADNERSFLRQQWPGYQHVSEYLKWAKPRLEAIRAGNSSVDARIWRRDFIRALHRRISLKTAGESGRKRNDSYRQRLNQFPRSTNAGYLRRFAQRGASTIH